MSATIDERVVSMRFDNKQFEAGVAESMSTLEKLKAKLDFKGAGKGLEDIGKAASNVDFSPMERNIGVVEAKFSNLQIVAITAMQRITNSVMDAGERIVKSLTIDQVTAGFDKYAQKTSAVQTIMNATGLSIEEVSDSLEKLNWFTDETSYNFTEMVNNIAKFTNNKVPLENAISAMEGIALVAADAGANSQEASRAMYNFSQAIATGAVKLIDWKSIENANMATSTFKQSLIDAAVEVGTLTKAGEGLYKTTKKNEVSVTDFNSALKDEWLTNEVLLKSLGEFSAYADAVYDVSDSFDTCAQAMAATSEAGMELGARAFKAGQQAKTFKEAIEATADAVSSGWMRTFEIIFGNYEESVALWSNFTDVLWDIFASGAEKRNDVLNEWKKLGGRDAMLDAITNSWEALLSILGPVKEAFREIFPAATGQQLYDFTVKVSEFTSNLKISEEAAYTLKVAIKTLLVPIRLALQVLKVGATIVARFALILWKLADAFIAIPAKTKIAENALENLFGNERFARAANIFGTALDRVGNLLVMIKNRVLNLISTIVSGGGGSKLLAILSKVYEFLSPIANFILDRILDGLEAIVNADFSKTIDFVKGGLSIIIGRLETIRSMVSPLTNVFTNFFSQFKGKTAGESILVILEALTNVKTQMKDFISTFDLGKQFKNLKKNSFGLWSVIDQLADAFGNLTDRLDPAKIMLIGFGTSLTAVLFSVTKMMNSASGIFTGFTGVLSAFQDRIKPNKYQQIATALTKLAGSLLVLALVDPVRLKQATESMIVLMTGLAGLGVTMGIVNKVLVKTPEMAASMVLISKSMTLMATAVLELAIALRVLADIHIVDAIEGLAIIGTLMAALVVVSKKMAKVAPELTKNSLFLIAFAMSIRLIISSMESLANADLSGVIANLANLAIIITAIGLLAKAASKVSFTSGLGLTVVILDLLLLVKVIERLSDININALIGSLDGFGAVMAAFLVLCAATRLAGKQAVLAAVGIAAMSVSLLLIGTAIDQIGSLDLRVVAKGTAAVSAIMLLFSLLIAVSKVTSGSEAVKMEKSFLAVGVAILALSGSIAFLGSLKLKVVTQGTIVVTALMGMFALLTKAGGQALKATGPIAAMSVAIGLLTASMMMLTLVPFDEALGAATVLSLALLAFTVSTRLLQDIPIKQAIAQAILFGTLIAELTWALRELATIDAKQTLMQATALGEVIFALSVATKLMNTPPLGKTNLTSTLKSAVAIGVLLAAVTLALGYLSAFGNSNDMLIAATALSEVLLALSGAMGMMIVLATSSKVASGGGVLKGMGALAIVVGAITAVIVAIGALMRIPEFAEMVSNGTEFIKMLGVLSPTILLLTAVAGAMAVLGLVAPQAAAGAIAFGLIMAEIAAMVSIFGRLANDPDFLTFIEKGADIFAALGRALGAFFGNLVGAFAGGVATTFSAALPDIADNLSKFMDKLQPFLDSVKTVDDSMTSGALNVAKMIMALSAAELVQGLTNFLPFIGKNTLSDFGKELEAFAPYLASFATTMKQANVDSSILEASTAAAESLAVFATKIPGKGGLLQSLAGEKSLSQFGLELMMFGPAFAAYAASVAGVKPEVITASSAAADTLAEFANKIPGKGGLLQQLAGEQSMSVFGTELVAFGESFAIYADEIENVKPEVVTASANAAQSLAEFANKIPGVGGVLQELAGSKSMSLFGQELEDFGGYFASYAQKIDGVTPETVTASANAAQSLVELANNLPKSGGLAQAVFGQQDLGEFGNQLSLFAEGMGAFAESMFSVSEVLDSANILDNVKMVGEKMGNKFAEGIRLAGENAKEAGQALVRKFAEGINADAYKAVSATRTMAENATKAAEKVLQINSPSKTFAKIGEYVVAGFVNGIQNNQQSAIDIMVGLANKVQSASEKTLGVASPSRVFAQIGSYVVQGFNNGIVDNTPEAVNGMVTFSKKLLQATKDFFEIQSPSKVTRDQVGRYIVKGIAEGIKSDMSAEEAASQKAKNIVDAFKTELDKLSLDMTTADLETQLWTSLNSGASDMEKAGKQMSLLENKLKLQAERVNYANAEYQTTLKTLGTDAEETQEAYNKYLQEQITMADLAAQLSEARTTTTRNQTEALLAYSEYMSDADKILKVLGGEYTMEDIQKAAAEASGIQTGDANKLATDTNAIIAEYMNTTVDALAESMSTVDVVIQQSTVATAQKAAVSARTGGATVAQSYADGVTSKSAIVQKAVQNTLGVSDETAEELRKDFKGTLAGAVDGADEGILENGIGVINRVGGFFNDLLDIGKVTLDEHSPSKKTYEMGEWFVEGFNNGLRDSTDAALVRVSNLSHILLIHFKTAMYDGFYQVGVHAMDGMIEGMQSKETELREQARKLAEAASAAAAASLSIASPSRVFMSYGQYVGEGFILGMRAYQDRVASQASELGAETILSMSNTIARMNEMVDRELDFQPTITPVLDMSEIQAGSKELQNLTAPRATLRVSSIAARASATAARIDGRFAINSEKQGASQTVNNYTFNQTNNSPKALARKDIYRQSKNLFAQFKTREATS